LWYRANNVNHRRHGTAIDNAVVRRAAIKQKRELVLFYFYFSFIAVVQTPKIKLFYFTFILVLFQFYFSFIAVVQAALGNMRCSLCTCIWIVSILSPFHGTTSWIFTCIQRKRKPVLTKCILLDTTASSSATRTVVAADRYGWIMLRALGVRQKFRSVNMQDGEDTTAATQRTCQYRVIVLLRPDMQVSSFSVMFPCLFRDLLKKHCKDSSRYLQHCV